MTQSHNNFPFLRFILKGLGLSPEAIDDIITRIIRFLTGRSKEADLQIRYPYHIRDDFLSPAEHSFFLVLKHIVGDQAVICPKVSLADLFYVRSRDRSKYRTYTNKIDRKHIDFLLCDPKTLRPLVGIELDDKSHQRADRRKRDHFVNQVFVAAKLPLARFPVRRSYTTAELDLTLQPYFVPQGSNSDTQPIIVDKSNAVPRCPKCESEMVLRTATRGSNRGSRFWGCPNYPKCRGIQPFEA